MNQADTVVFRKWKNGNVIALFPELPADIFGDFCDAYETVGQHGGADYHGVIQQTEPCSLVDATDLASELKTIGYELKPVRRVSHVHHERRRRTAADLIKTM
jgi:hypothetical protein